MSDEEKLAEANRLKNQGNEAFKAQKFDQAIKNYKSAVEYIDKNEAGKDLKLTCWLNTAQVAINKHDYALSIEHATKVITNDPKPSEQNLLKAYFRRGVARSHYGMAEEARDDF